MDFDNKLASSNIQKKVQPTNRMFLDLIEDNDKLTKQE